MPYTCAIDFGTDNFAAIVCDDGSSAIYKGGAVLSDTQWFHKQKAKYVSILTKGYKNQYAASKRSSDLSYRHANFVKDQCHKISRSIIDFCVDHQAGTLIFGVNPLWKQHSKIGKINNQKFVSMPIAFLRSMITYKALNAGIKIIEQDEARCRQLSELLPNAMIIHGDGSDQQVLLEEGILQTEAFASLTGFDEENIMLSLYAASKSNAKLITKVNRIAFESVINSLNLGSLIQPKMLTADLILQYVRAMQNSMGSNVETLYKIVADKAEALEFRVKEGSPLLGIPLERLQLKNNLLVACINRSGCIITPRGKDTIEAGDTVIIVTTHTGLNDLTDILK